MSKEDERKDPEEVIQIKRKEFEEELQKAHTTGFQIGSSEKYKTLGSFLFGVVEKYAELLTPKKAEKDKFLKFVVHSLEEQYLNKYEPKKEKEDEEEGKVQDTKKSEEAPKGGHEDVHQGKEGRSEIVKEDEKEVKEK